MGLAPGKKLLRRLKYAYTQSETKLAFVIGLWALVHKMFPAVPIELPSMDLGGLGTITPSLATLGVYVIGRVLFKGATDGELPFVPNEKKAEELEAEDGPPAVPPSVGPIILVGALLLSGNAFAQDNPPRFALERFSLGAGAGVHAYGDPVVGDVEAHGVLSYRMTEDLGVHANPEYGFNRSNGILRLGAHTTLSRGEVWRVAAGYDFISHFGGARDEFNDDGHGPYVIASKKLGNGWAGQVFVNEDFKNGAGVRLNLARRIGGGE